jgi:hypothetical protein
MKGFSYRLSPVCSVEIVKDDWIVATQKRAVDDTKAHRTIISCTESVGRFCIVYGIIIIAKYNIMNIAKLVGLLRNWKMALSQKY